MQAVADFYAGFALFMLAGSLVGLAVVVFQPFLDRFRSSPPRRSGSGPSPVADLSVRSATPDPHRKAA